MSALGQLFSLASRRQMSGFLVVLGPTTKVQSSLQAPKGARPSNIQCISLLFIQARFLSVAEASLRTVALTTTPASQICRKDCS